MSWNAGAGRPIRFRCWRCRRRDLRGAGFDVMLTGRTRERSRATTRHGHILVEYICRACGHAGWSSHVDLTAGLR